jgi:DNA invertase Pin-like site-specific DNA recombinase
MIRVAIYARFSSDLQNDKSVDDQIAFCREVCARNGMTVVLTFEDRAVSASSAKNRPGFIALMRAAAARLFDVVVAEDMDRIFRDQADYHAARKELDFLGITIHTATGKVTKIDGALRALMGEMYLENLALHVRRGLEGVIRDGRHAGGRAYAIPSSRVRRASSSSTTRKPGSCSESSRALLPASRLAPLLPNSMPIALRRRAALGGTHLPSMATTRGATTCCSMSFMPAVSSGTRCGWSRIRPRASGSRESMRRSSVELPRRRNCASSMM